MIAPPVTQDDAFHRRLARYNRWRLRPRLPQHPSPAFDEGALRAAEGAFVARERAAIARRAATAPRGAESFVEWFGDLAQTGPGQGDALFAWLATTAGLPEMSWFVAQEVAGEAGFDDLVALTQVRMPAQAKLELARNYWDEMGRGRANGMHGPMLAATIRELDVSPGIETTVWEALALGNLMVALALDRGFAFHAIGALGVIEMTAPARVAGVAEGLNRLGISARGSRYFRLHAGLDVRHSAAWNREVIGPLVADDPDRAVAIAEGALLRLAAGARCFARYRATFGLDATALTDALDRAEAQTA